MLENIHQYTLEFSKDLVNEIYNLKNKSSPKLRSNVLGWQSEQYQTTDSIPWINILLKQCYSVANLKTAPTAIWFNISPVNAYHTWHSHGKSSSIGIFYIQIYNNSGNIEFRQNNVTHSITPREGLLLIAPAGIDHRVLPNKSDGDRISMAFNLDT
jgi:hypothetical protein